MAEPIMIQTDDLQDTIVIHVHGEVDIGSAPVLRDAMMSAIRSRRHVVVDLAHVTYIDMSGFHVLEEGKQAADGRRGIALTASSPLVHKVIDIIESGKVLPLCPSLQSALDTVRAHHRRDRDKP